MPKIERRATLVMLGLLASMATAARAQETSGAEVWQRAQEDYAVGRYADAYGGFAHLADSGRAEAARVAIQMHRFGPMLYRQSFTASREQLRQWHRTIDRAARGESPQLVEAGPR